MAEGKHEDEQRQFLVVMGDDGRIQERGIAPGERLRVGTGAELDPSGAKGGSIDLEADEAGFIVRSVQGARNGDRPLAAGARLPWQRPMRLGEAIFTALREDLPFRVPLDGLPGALRPLLDDEADLPRREGRHNGRLLLGLLAFPPLAATFIVSAMWTAGNGLGLAEGFALALVLLLAIVAGLLLYSGLSSVAMGLGPRLVSGAEWILLRERRDVVVLPRAAVRSVSCRWLRIADDGIPRIFSIEVLFAFGSKGCERRLWLEPAFWWIWPEDFCRWLGAVPGARGETASRAAAKEARGREDGEAAPAASTEARATIHPLRPEKAKSRGFSPARIFVFALIVLTVNGWITGNAKKKAREARRFEAEERERRLQLERRRAATPPAAPAKVPAGRSASEVARAKALAAATGTRRTGGKSSKSGTSKAASNKTPRPISWGKTHLGVWSSGDLIVKADGSFYDIWTFRAQGRETVEIELQCPLVTPKLFLLRQGSKNLMSGQAVAGKEGVVRLSRRLTEAGQYFVMARGGPKGKPGLYRLRCSRK